MKNEINQEQRAFLAWNILCQCAVAKRLITYKELGEKMGVHHRTARFFLDIIQNYCLEQKIPPLTMLVVNQSGLPGDGFIAWDVDDFDQGVQYVNKHNWLNIPNPFAYAEQGSSSKALIKELLDQPSTSEEVYSKIKVRGIAQDIFRKALLNSYENKCAVCGLGISEVLEACHIIPWTDCSRDEKMNVTNGILLRSNHHKFFDRNILTIDRDYKIHFNAKFKEDINDYLFIQEELKLDKKTMRLPKEKKHWPNQTYLERRYSLL